MQPTQPLQKAIRRLALTTKQGPHNYYKGNRTGAMGSHTKWGGYKIDWSKVRTYVVPDLTDFNVCFITIGDLVERTERGPKDANADIHGS
jgi:large subunit ribosomal protein L41